MPVQKYDIRKPQAEGGEFEERHWSPVNTPVFDESGEIKYIIHRVEDITEFVKLQRRGGEMEYEVYLRSKEVSDANKKLLEANKELAELNRKMKEHSLQRLRAVEDNAVDGLITIDDRGVIESFNPACEKIFGYKKEEVIGQNIKMLMPEPYHSQHDGYLDNYHRTGVAKIIGIGREVSGKRKDGSVFPMDLSVGAFYLDDGKHYSGIVRDITERKESEELKNQLRQAQKIEAIGQLTGGIAHDFNNLLAVILGNLDMLSERVKPKDPLHEFIKPSIEAAERGAELTQSLLAFSRKQSLQPKVLSINDIIMNFSTLVSRTLGERVELMYSLAPYIWPVNVDSGQLENALLNLSVNSRDAMPKGGKLIYETKNVHLDGEYSSHNPEVIPGDYVMIAVTDTGEGMDSETIEKAFEPFFTTKDIGKGSGLGLSMVHGFVKQSNGHVKNIQ
jgi:PAS domain S-box-containing protein